MQKVQRSRYINGLIRQSKFYIKMKEMLSDYIYVCVLLYLFAFVG